MSVPVPLVAPAARPPLNPLACQPSCIAEALTAVAMAGALRDLPDLADAAERRRLYAAAGVAPADVARLDREALLAETLRRSLFPAPDPVVVAMRALIADLRRDELRLVAA